MLISLCENTKIANNCQTTTDRRVLEPTKKRYPTSKDKKPQWDSRRGTIRLRSNPITARCVTYKLENSNTKNVLTLLWKFWAPYQDSQPGDLTKELGVSRESDPEGQWDLIKGLSQDWGKQKLQSWRSQTKYCILQDLQDRSSGPTGDNQNHLLVLEGLLWRHGLTGAHHRDGNTGNRSPRSPYPLGISPLGSHH